MKKPNDIKRKNNGGCSLGQLLRSRERLIHITMSYHKEEHVDEKTGIVTERYVPDFNSPRQYTPNKKTLLAQAAQPL